jgi:SPP1 family predicted phage head-tail adaptor
MAVCTKIYRKSKRVCIGSLNRRAYLYDRAIQPPAGSSVDFTELFTPEALLYAMIETTDGTVVFADTNTEATVTHNIYIRYRQDVTAEKWLLLPSINSGDDQYLDILMVENFGENNRFLKLRCNIRGKDSLPVNEV